MSVLKDYKRLSGKQMRLKKFYFTVLFFALTVTALAGTPKQKDASPAAPTGLLSDGMTNPRAVVPTVKGDIASSLEIVSSGKLIFNYSIPANSKVLVCIPVGDVSKAVISEGNKTIWENGSFTSPVPGISYDGKDDQSVRFMVGSGNYTFKANKGKYFKIR
jgi:hypothetical protein